MNNPEYILVDEFEKITADIKTELNLFVLNYQYGYITELRETLAQMETNGYDDKKFPLLWFKEPFTEVRNNGDYYADVSLEIFIIQASEKTLKAKERMDVVFKPVLLPIYRELLRQINIKSDIFENLMNDHIPHSKENRYYWGKEQADALDDVFDCLRISNLQLQIGNNPNCSIN